MKPIEHLQKRFIAEQAKLAGWIEIDKYLDVLCYNRGAYIKQNPYRSRGKKSTLSDVGYCYDYSRKLIEMIEIPLSKTGVNAGKYVAIIDDEDEILSRVNWTIKVDSGSNTVYAMRTIKKNRKQRRELLHRMVMERMEGRKLLKTEQVDHIDMNGLNNTRNNLRIASTSQNRMNRGMSSKNKTGYKGVSYVTRIGRYRAQIQANKAHYDLGYFDTPEEAHEAYKEAAIKYHGEFANFGDDK